MFLAGQVVQWWNEAARAGFENNFLKNSKKLERACRDHHLNSTSPGMFSFDFFVFSKESSSVLRIYPDLHFARNILLLLLCPQDVVFRSVKHFFLHFLGLRNVVWHLCGQEGQTIFWRNNNRHFEDKILKEANSWQNGESDDILKHKHWKKKTLGEMEIRRLPKQGLSTFLKDLS